MQKQQVDQNSDFWFNFYLIILPILIYPVMIILELLIHFNLFKNIIIQFIVGIYFFIIPLYPIFFRLDRKPTNLIISENLAYLIVSDLAVYILFAVFLDIFSLSFSFINIFTFSIALFIGNFLISLFRMFKPSEVLRINKKNHIDILFENLSYFKKESKNYRFFPKNYLLLLVFLLTAGIFVVLRFPILYGDDPWFHTELTRLLVETGSFKWINAYNSLIGLFSLGGSFQLLSQIDILTITRWFPVFTFLIGGILGFTAMKFFFKNDQIAILGGVIFVVTPFNMALVLGQYWPTSIVSILCLGSFLFSLKIVDNQQDSRLNYLFLILTGISSFFVHDFTALLMNIGFIFVYVIQTLRQRKNNIRMVFIYVFILGFSLILREIEQNSVLSGSLINIMTLPYYIWIIIIIVSICGIYILHKIFTGPSITSDLEVKTFGKEKKSFGRKITDFFFKKKFLFLNLAISLFTTIISYFFIPFFYGTTQIKLSSLLITTFFTTFAFLLVGTSIITYQRKNFKGDILFFWVLYFGLILAGIYIINLFFNNFHWPLRIIINASGAFTIAMVSYIHIHFKKGNLMVRKNKLILIVFLIGLFVNFGFLESGIYQYKTETEINTAKIMGNSILNNDSIVISGFRWNYIIEYYSNSNLSVDWEHAYLINIENQTNINGENYLIKNEANLGKNNTFILLENTQMSLNIYGIDYQNNGILTTAELQKYCTLPYLDMVLNSKSQNDVFQQLYWLNLANNN